MPLWAYITTAVLIALCLFASVVGANLAKRSPSKFDDALWLAGAVVSLIVGLIIAISNTASTHAAISAILSGGAIGSIVVYGKNTLSEEGKPLLRWALAFIATASAAAIFGILALAPATN